MTTPKVQTPDPGWEQLFSEVGRLLLEEAETAHATGATPERIGQRFRAAGHDTGLIAAVLTQLSLRAQAASKFGPIAQRLLFTRAGLEQASRALVADAHAARFTRAGVTHVTDLGCGLGAESLALLRAGVAVRAVEIDPFTAQLAAHNLSQLTDAPPHDVVVGDAVTAGVGVAEAAFFDPARRTSGHRDTRRITAPDDYSPPLSFAFETAARVPTGIKLGPGFDRELIPAEAEAQWVSVNGSVVETGLWFGSVKREGITRSAMLFTDRHGEEPQTHELTAADDTLDAEVGELAEYLYEPDGAVIRARLIGNLARDLGAHMLDQHIAYMCSDTRVDTPFAQGFRVVEELSAREKDLAKELAKRDIGRLEIKKRGVGADPSSLRKRLKLRGSREATLVLTRVGEHHRALLCERL